MVRWELLAFAKLEFGFLWVTQVVSLIQIYKICCTEKSAAFSFFFFVALGILVEGRMHGYFGPPKVQCVSFDSTQSLSLSHTMPLDGPSSSRNTTSTGDNDSESHGKGATTCLVNGSTTSAKSRRNKGKGSGTGTPLLDKEELPATFEEPSFEDNVDFIAFEPEPHERYDKGEQEDLPVGERDRLSEIPRTRRWGQQKAQVRF